MFADLFRQFQSKCFTIPYLGHPLMLATFKSNLSDDDRDQKLGCDVDRVEVVSNFLTSYFVMHKCCVFSFHVSPNSRMMSMIIYSFSNIMYRVIGMLATKWMIGLWTKMLYHSPSIKLKMVILFILHPSRWPTHSLLIHIDC